MSQTGDDVDLEVGHCCESSSERQVCVRLRGFLLEMFDTDSYSEREAGGAVVILLTNDSTVPYNVHSAHP